MRFRLFSSTFAASLVLPLGGALAQPVEAPIARSADAKGAQWVGCPPPMPAGCQLSVLHGDPSQPNADVFLRVPAGADLPAHSHTSVERMILVSGRMQVKYRGAPATVLTAGNYAFGPAGLPHRAKCLGPQNCTLFIAFEGPVDLVPFAGSVE